MFDTWRAEFTPSPHRVVDPPVPVIVNVALAIGEVAGRPANSLPLRVRAEGLSVDVEVPGQVHGWARTSRGTWLCKVRFAIPTGNARGYLEVDQWCPAAAVRPCR
jgi:hypothetical protein